MRVGKSVVNIMKKIIRDPNVEVDFWIFVPDTSKITDALATTRHKLNSHVELKNARSMLY